MSPRASRDDDTTEGQSQIEAVAASAKSLGRPAVGTAIGRKLGPAAAIVAIFLSPFAAQSADDITIPTGYRNWFHVNTMIIDKSSPLYDALGGMHNIYINAIGGPSLQKGGPYPDRTIFLDDLHDFTVSEGEYVEGPRKAVVIMVKDSARASTGGWAWQAWAGGDPNKPIVTDAAKQCFECHQARKEQGYVYSTYIP
jgi:hypothetical protein